MFFKIGVLKNFATFTKTPVLESLFIKLLARKAFFYRTPLVAASELNCDLKPSCSEKKCCSSYLNLCTKK